MTYGYPAPATFGAAQAHLLRPDLGAVRRQHVPRARSGVSPDRRGAGVDGDGTGYRLGTARGEPGRRGPARVDPAPGPDGVARPGGDPPVERRHRQADEARVERVG